jgi:hypothetical protein
MVSGDGDLTAIIDFSPVAGDPRLDLAGALLFLEMTPGARSADAAFVAERLGGAGDEELQAIIDLYGTYYALYYSDCRLTDPDLYRWCMRRLAAH